MWEEVVLDQVIIFNITVRTLLESITILMAGLIIGNLLKHQILKLSRNTKFVWIFNEETASLLRNLVILVAIIYSLDQLGILDIGVAGTKLSNILTAVLFFYFAHAIGKKTKAYWVMRAGGKGPEVQLKAKLFYYILITLAFFIALNIAGFTGKLTTVLAAAGITGIVLGFSAQTVVANFISGIFMYFDKPIKIGDPVEVAGYSGIVHDIRILSTRIRTWDGLLVRIPNEKLFNSEIKNLMKYPARRVDVVVGIAYKEDIDRAIDVIKRTLEDMAYVLAEPEPAVFVQDFGDNSVNISIKAWAPAEKWYSVRTEILKKIKEALEREGIEIPFPQRVNWFAQELRVKVERDQPTPQPANGPFQP
ncbi:mechanosensitive ion channel family protein [Pyrococcus yayanosii]|uniref:Small-conductance mechanosensitive channel n=1 Tax=Pyrococcus yayanosii (strain CH1 / JCM 16557) TaxID=529709 RepID=F8AF98_PYRYC|nr:mechanosensitive ion channel family protein [Pyrococcus yayanosii]AEH24928.1 small-conductance mechanosensitive channel [Pyrococcus yayanosii CH1]